MTPNEIVPYVMPTGDQLGAILTQANMLVKAGFLPDHLKGSPDKVAAVITLGNELGLGPWAAINNVFVIGGKPSINVNLMQALVQRSGQLEDLAFKEVSDKRCEVHIKRRGVASPYIAVFTIDDANRAGLTTGRNGTTWKNYTKLMLKARALSDGYRVLFSDVLMGLYTPEELGAAISYDEKEGSFNVSVDDIPPFRTEPVVVSKEAPAAAKKDSDEDYPVTAMPPELAKIVGEFDGDIYDSEGKKVEIQLAEEPDLTRPNFEGIKEVKAQKEVMVKWLKSQGYINNDDELKLVSKKLADQGIAFAQLGAPAFLNKLIEAILNEWPDRLENLSVEL